MICNARENKSSEGRVLDERFFFFSSEPSVSTNSQRAKNRPKLTQESAREIKTIFDLHDNLGWRIANRSKANDIQGSGDSFNPDLLSLISSTLYITKDYQYEAMMCLK